MSEKKTSFGYPEEVFWYILRLHFVNDTATIKGNIFPRKKVHFYEIWPHV